MSRIWISDVTVPAGNQITNTATPTSFRWAAPWPANLDGPGNAGRTFRIEAHGSLSSSAATPGTLTLSWLWGSTLLATTGAVAIPVSLINSTWEIDTIIRVAATGASGLVSCQGALWGVNTALNAGMINPGLAQTGMIAINTQNAATIALQATFSVANASNIITLLDMIFEEIG